MKTLSWFRWAASCITVSCLHVWGEGFTSSPSVIFSGAGGLGSTTFRSEVIELQPGVVDINLYVFSSGQGTSGIYVDEWLFSVDRPVGAPVFRDGIAPVSVNYSPAAYGNAGVAGFGTATSGLFDLEFKFSPQAGKRLQEGTVALFEFDAPGLSVYDFTHPGAAPFAGSGPFFSVLHVANVPGDTSGSGLGVGNATVPVVVPEPSVTTVVGAGLLVGWAVGGRRRLF
jgi:hypothetical protein